MSIYKTFDSSEFLFEVLWKHFPTIITTEENNKIINTLIISSKDFCDLKSQNKFNIKYFSEGGFGAVGEIGMDNKKFKAAIFSMERSGNNNLFYTDVIVKIAKQINPPKIYRINISTINITDPLSDIIFGSLLGHLYDIGICPFVTKYFGTYLCKNNESSMIIESANYELYTKLNRNRNGRIGHIELKNLLIQYIYCLYILKIHYGAVHFDSHLRNIMISDITLKDYIYHGKHLKNNKYILYETGLKDSGGNPIIIMTKQTNNLLKLIDYGSMAMFFDRSHFQKFKRNLRIFTDSKDISSIGALDALNKSSKNTSFANTVDLLFTLINIYEYLRLNLDGFTGFETNIKHLKVVDDLTESLFGIKMQDFIVQNPQFTIKKDVNGVYDWFMRNHSSGLPEYYTNLKYMMQGLVSTCSNNYYVNNFFFENTKYFGKRVNIYYTEDITQPPLTPDISNSIFLTHNPSDYEVMFNRFEKLIKYEEDCKLKKGVYCDVYKLYNQESQEKFIDNNINFSNKNVSWTTILSSFNKNPTYKNYNSWLNGTAIDPTKITKSIEDVRINTIEIKDFSSVNITTNSTLTSSCDLCFPVGNFATFKNKTEPLGFFAKKNPTEIYQHLYPSIYHKYLAVIILDENNVIQIEKYIDFINRHETTPKLININLDKKEFVDSINIPVILKSGITYKWAVTVGPLLVYNKKITFDENDLQQISSQLYLNESEKIFIGKTPGYFGMGNSSELQSQLIFAIKKNKVGLIFVEGGGYLSIGIDKVSSAKLCNNLGIDYAVSIYSGFSSNVLLKTNKHQYISKSPIRITHGAVMEFNF